ncbi:MAG TPA: FAD-linked oxidase C-terminal domain-containing protein, partial [Solirubrobacteraceae bacterium]|nr:FAD-linked oxidase C-terminal domain-containing protein [Solirubrobacteraceae bacterium]
AVRRRRLAARSVFVRHRALQLGTPAGKAWHHGRFGAPYLRDVLLDRRVMVDTLETATTWTDLERLKGAVTEAIAGTLAKRGTPAFVGCHVSHVYTSGASLYFTYAARQETGAELEQWRAVKAAASDAIVAGGGTITHHHGVGRDHAPWLAREAGGPALDALRAAKAAFDPAGIMNPGKLVDGTLTSAPPTEPSAQAQPA